MIFVDTNVFLYAVGRPHPLREQARGHFRNAVTGALDGPLVTSAEVMQELVHAYLPVTRMSALDAALELVEASMQAIWPIEAEDVISARMNGNRLKGLGARELLHVACCRRRGVTRVLTFDRALASAFT